MRILCIKDITSRNVETGELEKNRAFLKGDNYEVYPTMGKTNCMLMIIVKLCIV